MSATPRIFLRAILAVLLLAGVMPAVATADDLSLTVEVERPAGPIFPQEMLLLRIRGTYTLPIALEKLDNPELPGTRWLPVGGDMWSQTDINGRPARLFERTLAVFPQQPGRLEIPAFHHLLTLAEEGRREVTVSSAPLALDIAAPPSPDWWLPARGLILSESWSVPPEALAPGQSTRRTVTIEASGVTDDQLPPLPELRAPGLIAWPSPPERATQMGVSLDRRSREQQRQALRRPGRLPVFSGPDGPRARIVYSWDIRPTTDEPVELPPLAIDWFDTQSRTMRRAGLPARTVAVDITGPAIAALEAELGIAARPADTRLRDLALALCAALAAFLLTTLALRGRTDGGAR